MSAKLRVGFASLVHDHVWGEMSHWLKRTDVEIVAAGEADPRLRQKALDMGVPKVYDSWQELIASEQLDIVQAASENSQCADITEAAMGKGAHVLSEKPMAATLEQANRMVAAADKSGKVLMINWPNVWEPSFQEWDRQLMSGAIGRILHLKRRNAHNGPKEIGCDPAFWGWLYDAEKNGAGALMDYCCYGADIAARFLGLPTRVTGIRGILAKDYPVPDDNAVILMQYPQAIAMTEASWTEIAKTTVSSTVAYGTEGACWIQDGKVLLHRVGKDIEMIEPAPLKEPMRNGPEYFMHCISTGEPVEGFCSAKVSRDAQEILEAGLRSADTGVHLTLPL